MIVTVLKARRYGNTLYYNISKGEYTYFHKGHKIWTEKADPGLYDYVSGLYDYVRNMTRPLDPDELEKFPVYVKYAESCRRMLRRNNMEKLTNICKIVWKELSTEEKEAYCYGTGIIGFISNMARVLHKDVSTITSEDFATLSNELSWLC